MGFKSARIAAGKTVKDVMDHMGVSDAAVYQWESGVFTPRPDKLVKLANYFGVTVDELLKPDADNTVDERPQKEAT